MSVLQPAKARGGPTETVAVRDIGQYNSAVSQTFQPVRITSTHRDGFHGRLRRHSVGNLVFSEAVANQHRLERSERLIGESHRKIVMFNFQQAGVSHMQGESRQTTLYPGDMTLYEADTPYAIDTDDSFRMSVIMCPQDSLALSDEQVRQLAGTRMSGQTGMVRMVGALLTQLSADFDLLAGRGGVRLAHSVLDTVSTSLHWHLSNFAQSSGDTHRMVLRDSIKEFIHQNLRDPDLSPTEIASYAHISTRYLYGIFRDEGSTISAFIRQLRLERCRRDLADPSLSHIPIALVAYHWGLTDAPNFSRLFKAHFGVTASEYRQRANAQRRTNQE